MFTILVVLLAGLAVLLAYASTRPDTFQVRRAATIEAAPERIHPLIGDLLNWTAWSPYEKLDPAMKRTYRGGSNGAAVGYAWEGNRKAGKGRIDITRSTPASVTMRLQMLEPIACLNVVEFTLAPAGDATTVTWAMRGPARFMSRLLGIFVDIDRLVGRDFEAGLANLKRLAEQPSGAPGVATSLQTIGS